VTFSQKRHVAKDYADSILSIIPQSLQNIADVLKCTIFWT